MTDLIQIHQSEIDGLTQSTVDARELHAFIESKQRFSDWILNRIEQYGFAKDLDFRVYHKNMKNSQGGRPTKEYVLSMDMAKELAMVENNEQGRKIRRYFIECERRVRTGLSIETEHDRLLKKIHEAAAIVGSLTKLGAKLGITNSIFSHMNTGRWDLVSVDKLAQIEAACDYLLEDKGALLHQNEVLRKLMEVEPKTLRMQLVHLLSNPSKS